MGINPQKSVAVSNWQGCCLKLSEKTKKNKKFPTCSTGFLNVFFRKEEKQPSSLSFVKILIKCLNL
jgi:hypothetical protein